MNWSSGEGTFGVEFPGAYALGNGNDDLESVSAFLGSCFRAGSAMGGIWNQEFEGS